MFARSIWRRNFSANFIRNISEGTSRTTAPNLNPTSSVNANVPGLSSAVVFSANEPVGPGVDPKKSGAYKVPEYFCYNSTSYYEAEVEMAKYRLTQPSALKK